jgi:hypothetical protein
VGALGGASHAAPGWLSSASAPPPSDRVIALSRAPSPAPIPNMPPSTAPSGATLSLDSLSLRLNGAPILPIAGEMHPSRVPAARWREDLLKMKAGGLSSVSAYLMWSHTEEVRGAQDFSGNRNVSLFLDTAADVGLMVALRIGPWDHGECRNGGLPDWVMQSGVPLRSNTSAWLALVAPYYAAIAGQIEGLGWHEGGPISSIQLDNETPNSEYLESLRALAIAHRRIASMRKPSCVAAAWGMAPASASSRRPAPRWSMASASSGGSAWAAPAFIAVDALHSSMIRSASMPGRRR